MSRWPCKLCKEHCRICKPCKMSKEPCDMCKGYSREKSLVNCEKSTAKCEQSSTKCHTVQGSRQSLFARREFLAGILVTSPSVLSQYV